VKLSKEQSGENINLSKVHAFLYKSCDPGFLILE